ncbi:MAG TPA: hypothetical protein VIM90_11010, partial [Arenimonas sp.]
MKKLLWTVIAGLGLVVAGPALAQSAKKLHEKGLAAHRSGDTEAARGYFTKACDGGLATSCYSLGVMAYGNADGASDPVQARRHFERACELKARGGCANLGVMLLRGEGGEVDKTRARVAFKFACDASDRDACGSLGNMMVRGEGGAADAVEGRRLLALACNAGDNWSCDRIANYDANGWQPVLADQATEKTWEEGWQALGAGRHAEALPLLLPHAGKGDARAQYAVGSMYTYGQGTSRNYLEAARWLSLAAEQGHEEAQGLIVTIAPNIAQARFIDHVDRYGPDASSLQAFSNDVFDYCALKGPNCSALLKRRKQWENAHNARAEAENMARIWQVHGSGQNEGEFWSKA